ncbi:MAG: hypothetical protein HQK79_12740 [Desulfobacterales bacterium]|nr:hypothetical protein [Desulfobacterales bacterium]
MKRIFTLLVIINFLFAIQAYSDTTIIEVIELHYQTADEIIDIIKPFAGTDGTISGIGSKLIIKTTPENLSEIKKIIKKIDIAPRQLIITVRQNVTSDQLDREVSASSSINIGENGRVTIGDCKSNRCVRSKVSVNGANTSKFQHTGDVQQIKVIEGGQAFIQIGMSVPSKEQTIFQNRHGFTVNTETIYRDVTSGFYVLPRIKGEQVIMEIMPKQGYLDNLGSIHNREAFTKINCKMGEWVELGSIVQEISKKQNGINSFSNHNGNVNHKIFVKVDEIK